MLSNKLISGVRDLGACRVLVVEDDADTAELLNLTLLAAGFVVCVAHSARQALAAAPSFLPMIALIDIGLPGMDGCELCKVLRETPGLNHCRFVVSTGYVGPDIDAQIRDAGFHARLTKPYDWDRLGEAIAHTLRDSAGQAEG